MIKHLCCFLFVILLLPGVSAQPSANSIIRKYAAENALPIFTEYMSFLAIPNVAADPAGLEKNAAFIMQMMKDRGIQKVQLLTAETSNAIPAVYGEIQVPGATKTLIFLSK